MRLSEHKTHKSGRRKTVCTSAVLGHFGIHPDSYHYSENRTDVERILRRNGFSVRSRRSKIVGLTIGAAREAIRKLRDKPGARYYVSVPGHAMLLDEDGRTVVDTAPVKRDRRKVLAISVVEGLPPNRTTHKQLDRDAGVPDRFAGMRISDLSIAQAEALGRYLRKRRKELEAEGGRIIAVGRG